MVREKKMHAMRGSKYLYSRILGGSEKGSEGRPLLMVVCSKEDTLRQSGFWGYPVSGLPYTDSLV
jgi:hypothetical protein